MLVGQASQVTYSFYGLNSVHYCTCSHLSVGVFLKASKATVELLKNRTYLEMAENWIRQDVSSVLSKRLAITNNKFLQRFDETEPRTNGLLVDANNLNRGVFQIFALPSCNFESVTVILSSIRESVKD